MNNRIIYGAIYVGLLMLVGIWKKHAPKQTIIDRARSLALEANEASKVPNAP